MSTFDFAPHAAELEEHFGITELTLREKDIAFKADRHVKTLDVAEYVFFRLRWCEDWIRIEDKTVSHNELNRSFSRLVAFEKRFGVVDEPRGIFFVAQDDLRLKLFAKKQDLLHVETEHETKDDRVALYCAMIGELHGAEHVVLNGSKFSPSSLEPALSAFKAEWRTFRDDGVILLPGTFNNQNAYAGKYFWRSLRVPNRFWVDYARRPHKPSRLILAVIETERTSVLFDVNAEPVNAFFQNYKEPLTPPQPFEFRYPNVSATQNGQALTIVGNEILTDEPGPIACELRIEGTIATPFVHQVVHEPLTLLANGEKVAIDENGVARATLQQTLTLEIPGAWKQTIKRAAVGEDAPDEKRYCARERKHIDSLLAENGPDGFKSIEAVEKTYEISRLAPKEHELYRLSLAPRTPFEQRYELCIQTDSRCFNWQHGYDAEPLADPKRALNALTKLKELWVMSSMNNQVLCLRVPGDLTHFDRVFPSTHTNNKTMSVSYASTEKYWLISAVGASRQLSFWIDKATEECVHAASPGGPGEGFRLLTTEEIRLLRGIKRDIQAYAVSMTERDEEHLRIQIKTGSTTGFFLLNKKTGAKSQEGHIHHMNGFRR